MTTIDFSTIPIDQGTTGFGLTSGVEVIDSVMGTGKTTAMFKHIREHCRAGDSGLRFIYVSPFLSEVGNPKPSDADIRDAQRKHDLASFEQAKDYLIEGRCRREVPEANFKCPTDVGNGKYESFVELLEYGCNISTTHNLFNMIEQDAIDLIASQGYELLLDEALNCIEVYDKLSASDRDILIASGRLILNNETGKLDWTLEDSAYNGRYSDIQNLCNLDRLFLMGNTILMWDLSPTFLAAFIKVTISTYLFEGSLMCSWMRMRGIEFHYADPTTWKLLPHDAVVATLADNIHIYEGPHNAVGNKTSALSATWFGRNDPNIEGKGDGVTTLDYSAQQVFRGWNLTASKVMWTVYKAEKPKLNQIRFGRSFVACNIRSTNEYRYREAALYLVNRYPLPSITRYINENGGTLDRDQWALAEMLQWIWRIRIRDNQAPDRSIKLYIPSSRMRGLLQDWLASHKQDDKAA